MKMNAMPRLLQGIMEKMKPYKIKNGRRRLNWRRRQVDFSNEHDMPRWQVTVYSDAEMCPSHK